MKFRIVLATLIFASFFVGTASGAFQAVSTVTFFENDSAQDAVSTYQIGNSTSDLELFTSLSPAFSNPGYAFVDWNTSPDGSGETYADGAAYAFSSDLQLYAQWSWIPVVHTVTFFENDTGSDPVSTFESSTTAKALTSFDAMSPQFSKIGYEFESWNSQANGAGQSYANGGMFNFASDLSLYAIWIPIPSFSISFSPNGGSGSAPSISALQGSLVTLPSGNQLLRVGFSFHGWSTAIKGGAVLEPGSQVSVLGNTAFYAVWIALAPMKLVGIIKFSNAEPSTLSNGAAESLIGIAKFIVRERATDLSIIGFAIGKLNFAADQKLGGLRAYLVGRALKQDLGRDSKTSFNLATRGESSLPPKNTQFVEVFMN